MMKNTIKLLVLICLVIGGCTVESATLYTATWKNTSTHNVVVLPYRSGIVYDTIKMSPGAEFEIANGTTRGLVTSPYFETNYLGSISDSVVVIFDKIYPITHYTGAPAEKAKNFYDFTNSKSICNGKLYEFNSEKVGRHERKNTHVYYFTEDKYLDATK